MPPPIAMTLSRLRSSPRSRWWVTFGLIATVIGIWTLATPPFGSADEPAHSIRAAAAGRGQLIGTTPDPPDREGFFAFDVPAAYAFASRQAGCFAGLANETAACFRMEGSETALEPALSDAAPHPPAYYTIVGVVSRVAPTAVGALFVMRVATLVMSALLLTIAAQALGRARAPRLAIAAFLLAVTPMVLAFAGTVNPSAVEIAAGVATWACGLTLVSELRRGAAVDDRLVAQLGVAAAAFVLTRQISMFWVALIAVILAGLLGRRALLSLYRTVAARVWAAIVGLCVAAQLAWIAAADGLSLSVLPNADPDRPVNKIVEITMGRAYGLFLEMLGRPGWLDTRLLSLTHLLLIAALSVLVLLASAFGARRYVIAMGVAIVVTAVVPLALEALQARHYGFYWQGRYTLPFAVGVPLLAAFSLQSRPAERLIAPSRLVPIIGGMVVVAQFLAFYQALRRWSVGAGGPILFWWDPDWKAPLPQWLLLLVAGVALVGFATWLLTAGATNEEERAGAAR